MITYDHLWISLVVTSNHKCLNKVVSNITIDFNYFRARTWPPRWYIDIQFQKVIWWKGHLTALCTPTTSVIKCKERKVLFFFGYPLIFCCRQLTLRAFGTTGKTALCFVNETLPSRYGHWSVTIQLVKLNNQVWLYSVYFCYI